jgi:peptidoglycan/xylan/chitin deacetylase (PgdA/CDA1 family)
VKRTPNLPITPEGSIGTHWQLPILMYRSVPHHSSETAAPRSTPACQLEEQLASLIAAGWQPVGITEALRIIGENSSRRIVAMTFDEGLLDFLNAFDLLRRFGARATLYIPTRDIGMRVSRWDKAQSKLSWEHLAEVAEAGIEIGSQSVSGRPLDTFERAYAEDEVRTSKRKLEDRLAVPIVSFCYPQGYSSRRTRRVVAEAGYSNACILGLRIASHLDDCVALPRLRVQSGVDGQKMVRIVNSGQPGIGAYLCRSSAPAWQLTRQAAAKIVPATRPIQQEPMQLT